MMNKKIVARIVFMAYVSFVIFAYLTGKDRLVMLAMSILAGFGYLWRVMYVEDSENIITYFDSRIKDVINKIMNAIDDTNKRIDQYHPREENKND